MLFTEDLELLEVWKIPYAVVVAEAFFSARTNATRFAVTARVRNHPQVDRLV